MRVPSRVNLFVPCLALALSAQQPATLDAPIRRVRLHPDEAWVTRAGRIQAGAAGIRKVLLKGLPPGLALDDVRVTAQGPEGSRLGDVSVGSEPLEVLETAEWKGLLRQRENLAASRDALEAEGEATAQEVAFLKGLLAAHDKELAARLTYTAPKAETILELARGIQARLAEALTRERRRGRELDRLKEEQARLEAAMARRSGEQRKAPTRILVELATPGPGTVDLEVSYRVRDARWTPAYEFRLSPDRHQMELGLFALVTQSGGEAWEGVVLEISNTRPGRNLEAPRYERGQAVGWAPQAARGARLRTGAVVQSNAQSNVVSFDKAPEPPPGAQFLFDGGNLEEGAATLDEVKGLAVTYVLEGAKDVPPDGEAHRFKLLARQVEPRLRLVAVPRLDPQVHQIATFDPPSQFPLFPGAPVAQYAGASRLGQTVLRPPVAGQPYEVGFGPLRGVRVSFARGQAAREQVGAFTKERQWTLVDRVEAANDTGDPVVLEIQDRVLKASDDRIKVTQTASAPGEEKVPGVRTWSLALGGKEKASLALTTVLRAPEEGVLTGVGDLTLP